jgi:hypothetical protein
MLAGACAAAVRVQGPAARRLHRRQRRDARQGRRPPGATRLRVLAPLSRKSLAFFIQTPGKWYRYLQTQYGFPSRTRAWSRGTLDDRLARHGARWGAGHCADSLTGGRRTTAGVRSATAASSSPTSRVRRAPSALSQCPLQQQPPAARRAPPAGGAGGCAEPGGRADCVARGLTAEGEVPLEKVRFFPPPAPQRRPHSVSPPMQTPRASHSSGISAAEVRTARRPASSSSRTA